MTHPYEDTAQALIARCNLGLMDNHLHTALWDAIDAYTTPLDVANICTALAVAADTHGTPMCRSYIDGVLRLAVGPCLKPLLTAGKIEQFDILVEHMSDKQAFEVFECAIEHEHWKGALFVFLQHMTIEDWSDYDKCFAVGHLVGRTVKHMGFETFSRDLCEDLIAELERRALHNTLEKSVGDSPHSPRKKM
jgi:hypothetical protein